MAISYYTNNVFVEPLALSCCWHLSLNIYTIAEIEGILPKGPSLPCVSMAGRTFLVGYNRNMEISMPKIRKQVFLCLNVVDSYLIFLSVFMLYCSCKRYVSSSSACHQWLHWRFVLICYITGKSSAVTFILSAMKYALMKTMWLSFSPLKDNLIAFSQCIYIYIYICHLMACWEALLKAEFHSS